MTDVMEPERLSLHNDIAGKLREMIIRCELPPGERVPEHHFGQLFGVSRTPLREALKMLASEGLIEIRPNRGSVVAHRLRTMGIRDKTSGREGRRPALPNRDLHLVARERTASP